MTCGCIIGWQKEGTKWWNESVIQLTIVLDGNFDRGFRREEGWDICAPRRGARPCRRCESWQRNGWTCAIDHHVQVIQHLPDNTILECMTIVWNVTKNTALQKKLLECRVCLDTRESHISCQGDEGRPWNRQVLLHTKFGLTKRPTQTRVYPLLASHNPVLGASHVHTFLCLSPI